VIPCRRSRADLYLRTDDRLPFERGLALDAHLEQCADCRALAATLEQIDESLVRWPEPASERLDLDAAMSKIHARIGQFEEETVPVRAVFWHGTPLRLAAAAALIIAITGFYLLREDTNAERALPRDSMDVAESVPQDPSQDAVAQLPSVESDSHGQVQESAPQVGSEPIDRQRVRDARELLHAALLAASDELPAGASSDEALAFAAALDVELRGSGNWPWRRMSERILSDKNPRAARAAARYLGVRADRMSIAALAESLEREDLAREAALALRDAGATDHPALADALRDSARYGFALAALVDAQPATRAQLIASALEELPEREHAASQAQSLLAALADTGSAALPYLLEASVRGDLNTDELVALLDTREWAADALLDAAVGTRRGDADELALTVCARIAGDMCIDTLTAKLTNDSLRSAALDGFVALASPAAFGELVTLHSAGRLDFDEADTALHALAESNSDAAAVALTDALEASEMLGSPATQRRVAEWVLSLETSGAVPALRILASAGAIDPELRRGALLAIGELGALDDLEWLIESFRNLGPRERRLAAACLIAIHSLGEEAAALRALDGAPDRAVRPILNVLRRSQRRDRELSTHRLARALVPVLAEQESEAEGTRP